MEPKLEFYPEHPSDVKTHKIETTDMPILKQTAPFEAKKLCDEFAANEEAFYEKYVDKRFEVTGIATKIGPDIHNKPSIELSDEAGGKTYALLIFPTNDHYSKVKVGDKVTVRANYLVMSNWYGTVMKHSELVGADKNERVTLDYPLFDGHKLHENARVVIENGSIKSVTQTEKSDSRYFLMPGLIDAHAHMDNMTQVEQMLKNGVVGACDVSSDKVFAESLKQFEIVRSAGICMGALCGKAYVKNAMKNGAKYIKVLLAEPNLMLKKVFMDICDTAHKNQLKVAVHATSVKAVELSVECGVDILIHVPMKEEFPKGLAKTIADKGIVSAPTLVMMKAFAMSGRNGYKPEHFGNAKNAVKLLHTSGVKILVATDANNGSFAPAVKYGSSMHEEMMLLAESGLSPLEVLKAATSNVAKVFSLDSIGEIAVGKKANLLLVEGHPSESISDISKVKQVYIDGNAIL